MVSLVEKHGVEAHIGEEYENNMKHSTNLVALMVPRWDLSGSISTLYAGA